MWLELMQHIKSTIDNSGAAFNVMLGAMRPQAAKVDENGVIMIIRGETTRGDNSIQSELEQELYIEVWGVATALTVYGIETIVLDEAMFNTIEKLQ